MKALTFGSIAVLGYTYVGYPALMAARAALKKRDTTPAPPARPRDALPRVSVIVPIYNAERYVAPKIESLLAQDYPADKVEILMYSDASTDGSDAVVARFADRGVKLVRGEKRLGKPTALNALAKLATGEIFIMTDIRQPLSTDAISRLVERLEDDSVGCVSGNLQLQGETGAGLYWKYETFIRDCEAKVSSMVGVTGALYALRAESLGHVPRDLILDDMYIAMMVRLRGKRIVLEPGAIVLDEAFEDDREKTRKVRTLAGNFQLFSMVPALLNPLANPSFFETFSHKFLRLTGPVALAGAAVGSVAGLATAKTRGERRLYGLLVAGQLGLGALAALGPRAGGAGRFARTFLVLQSAVVSGFVRFVRGEQKVTW